MVALKRNHTSSSAVPAPEQTEGTPALAVALVIVPVPVVSGVSKMALAHSSLAGTAPLAVAQIVKVHVPVDVEEVVNTRTR